VDVAKIVSDNMDEETANAFIAWAKVCVDHLRSFSLAMAPLSALMPTALLNHSKHATACGLLELKLLPVSHRRGDACAVHDS